MMGFENELASQEPILSSQIDDLSSQMKTLVRVLDLYLNVFKFGLLTKKGRADGHHHIVLPGFNNL